MSNTPLDDILCAQKSGIARAIPSICSAHPVVLQTVLEYAPPGESVLVESTCNQVNQFGGYTGMTPAGFRDYLAQVCSRVGFPRSRLLLGGDHLGPLPWSAGPADRAMQNAIQLVREVVRVGYTKIHLDASMPCADDLNLGVEAIARRAAELAAAAEDAATAPQHLRYVIGTEVPAAGGSRSSVQRIEITSAASVSETISITRKAFYDRGLQSAWERVLAVVVQPGVEYDTDTVHVYQPGAASHLARFIESVPSMLYEAHSTDYQPRPQLQALVRDHFAILKVGPALTFAYRQGVFALAEMETELVDEAHRSQLRTVLERVMLENPAHWNHHYHGTQAELRQARAFSYSDRIRYYWALPPVQAAVKRLMENLSAQPLPLSLISQAAPHACQAILEGTLENTPAAIVASGIAAVLADYDVACGRSAA